jgi:hypothetical protein
MFMCFSRRWPGAATADIIVSSRGHEDEDYIGPCMDLECTIPRPPRPPPSGCSPGVPRRPSVRGRVTPGPVLEEEYMYDMQVRQCRCPCEHTGYGQTIMYPVSIPFL